MKKEPVELPRRRCDNCPHFFRPKQAKQRFCSNKCRMEFHRYGAAYGPLKDKLENLVEELIETKYHALDQRLRMCSEGLVALTDKVLGWHLTEYRPPTSEPQSTASNSPRPSR